MSETLLSAWRDRHQAPLQPIRVALRRHLVKAAVAYVGAGERAGGDARFAPLLEDLEEGWHQGGPIWSFDPADDRASFDRAAAIAAFARFAHCVSIREPCARGHLETGMRMWCRSALAPGADWDHGKTPGDAIDALLGRSGLDPAPSAEVGDLLRALFDPAQIDPTMSVGAAVTYLKPDQGGGRPSIVPTLLSVTVRVRTGGHGQLRPDPRHFGLLRAVPILQPVIGRAWALSGQGARHNVELFWSIDPANLSLDDPDELVLAAAAALVVALDAPVPQLLARHVALAGRLADGGAVGPLGWNPVAVADTGGVKVLIVGDDAGAAVSGRPYPRVVSDLTGAVDALRRPAEVLARPSNTSTGAASPPLAVPAALCGLGVAWRAAWLLADASKVPAALAGITEHRPWSQRFFDGLWLFNIDHLGSTAGGERDDLLRDRGPAPEALLVLVVTNPNSFRHIAALALAAPGATLVVSVDDPNLRKALVTWNYQIVTGNGKSP